MPNDNPPTTTTRKCRKRAMTTLSRETTLNWGEGEEVINFPEKYCKNGKVYQNFYREL